MVDDGGLDREDHSWPGELTLRPDGAGEAGAATGRPVLTAEWALWGRNAADTADHVLYCSNGNLTARDFTAFVDRYARSRPDNLPQYTLGWIPDPAGDPEYVGVAAHELAPAGRQGVFIRLFCVRFAELAAHLVPYPELVNAVRSMQLHAESLLSGAGSLARPPSGFAVPVRVPLVTDASLRSIAPAFRELAENVAALLLTTQPVCVLGAEEATAEDRLRFIELVMSLLPYGLRSRLSASTWASSTAQELKLRLFFADVRRDDGGAGSYVTWGRPQEVDLSERESEAPRLYLSWLRQAGPLAAVDLLGAVHPIRFVDDDVRRIVAELPRDRTVEATLEQLADSLHSGDDPTIRAAVKRIRQHLEDPLEPADREVFRRLILQRGLLKDHPPLHAALRVSLYRTLLRLAFEAPLTYARYCEIEDAVGGPPHGTLRQVMIGDLKFATYIPWLLTIKAEPGFTDEQLMAVLHEAGAPAAVPVDQLEEQAESVRPTDREVVYDFAVRHLRAYAGDPRAELARRGYLAGTLAALFRDDVHGQQVRLVETLQFIYGRSLGRERIRQLFQDPAVALTEALEAAVTRQAVSTISPRFVAERAAMARLSRAGHADDVQALRRGRRRRPGE